MMVRYFNIMGIPRTPLKTYTPLIVDADTILSEALACKFLQPVTRWYAQITQAFGYIQDGQFSPGQRQQVGRKFL